VAILDRIWGLNAQIAAVEADIGQARAELDMLRHIADDALRDAAVTDNYEDRADAKMTHADVARCERRIDGLARERVKLVRKRDRMVDKLAAG